MVDFSNLQIKNLIIHGIGNKSKDENIFISSSEISLTDEVMKQYLMRYFISSFKFDIFYSFIHQSDIQLNEVYNYSNNIFTDGNCFVKQSANIAKHLYEISTHPNIKKGELYIARLSGVIFDGKHVEALGIFKSEDKDVYLNVNNINNEYNVSYQKGVNLEKLDKGCIIFNIDKNIGYQLVVVDSNNTNSLYWKESFLKIKEKSNDYTNTKGVLKICKSFVKENEEMQQSEKVLFLNNSLSYFQNHKSFDFDEFSNEITRTPILNDNFKKYISDKSSDLDTKTLDNFQISPKAVATIKRNYKNYIKLDSNIEIRINSKVNNLEQIVEKGYDPKKNMNFYKIYFTDEE